MIKVNVLVNNRLTTALYDSGSNFSIIHKRIVDELRLPTTPKKSILCTMNKADFQTNRAILKLCIGKIQDEIEATVVDYDTFKYDLLLGLDSIRKFRLLQDEQLNIFQKILNSVNPEVDTPEYIEINFNENLPTDTFQIDLNHISDPEKKLSLLNIIEKYKHIFAKDKFDIGKVTSKEAEIKLIREEYVTARPYKCSIPDDKEICSQIKKLLEADIIEESDSPFASPVTLAYKKDEGKKSRLCIDFRKLNRLVVPECYPFPTINDVVEKTVNCQYFTVLDINSAFWCILLKLADREKTSFITKYGKFMFKVLPFGMKNSPAIFQRILSNIIRRNNLDGFCINYIDDILVFSQSWDAHLSHLEQLFHAITSEGFKLKLVKCVFAAPSVKYLGHIIRHNEILPAQENLAAIARLARPTDKSGVRSILGSINFYLKYIQSSSKKLEPLHRLLRKDVVFEWTNECEESFEMIKKYLCSSPILAIYDVEKPVIIETDASFTGLGATLKQPHTDGTFHPVAYFSRKLSARERHFDIIHLECQAIKDAIKYWQYYLIGRQFTVFSDHKPLENLKTKARTDERLGDLIHYLSQFNFRIVYKKGKENVLADLLSRYPVLEYFENEDAIQVVNLIQLSDIQADQSTFLSELKKGKNVTFKQGLFFKNLHQRSRIFVSPRFGQQIIEEVHNWYGHIGSAQLLAHIRPHYYFHNLDKAVHSFCQSCSVCVANKVRQGRVIGLLSKFGPPSEPFHIMSLDTVGGFSGRNSTHKYLHLLVDHFTRYAWILTSTTQTGKDFVRLLRLAADNHQISILLTDQYAGIDSTIFKDYLDSQNIQHVFTDVDCASSNGLNERLNQTLINRIRCKINADFTTRAWTTLAKECVAEYNDTIHSVTKFPPAYLLLGQTTSISPLPTPPSSLIADRQTAFTNSQANFEYNKKRIDQNRRDYVFNVGDLVYVSNGSKLNRRKLDPVRIGPFPILRQISNTFYEVAAPGRKRVLFHSCKLSPFPASQSTGRGEV